MHAANNRMHLIKQSMLCKTGDPGRSTEQTILGSYDDGEGFLRVERLG